MDSETRAERLRQLQRVVEEAPPERFDMTVIGDDYGCGTVACAAGWAALDPWHQAFTDIGEALLPHPHGVETLLEDEHLITHLAGLYGITFDDANRLFGLDYEASYDDCANASREIVIRNVDRLLSGLPALSYGDPTLAVVETAL